MENMEFYSTAAQTIPVLLLAILVQSSLVKGEIINAMETEERRLILEEATRRAARDPSSGGRVLPLVDLAEAWRGCAEDPQRQLDLAVQVVKAGRSRDLRRSVGITDRRPFGGSAILVLFSALVGLAVALGVLFANGAPLWVSLFVWQGIAVPGLFLLIHVADAIGFRVYLSRLAANARLVDEGILSQDQAKATDRTGRQRRYLHLRDFLSDYGFDEGQTL